MSYTILDDHSLWGNGKMHITDNDIELSTSLCGRYLSFAYETKSDYNFKLLNDCKKEDILLMNGVCKNCLKVLKK